jgi:hypothetical protein
MNEAHIAEVNRWATWIGLSPAAVTALVNATVEIPSNLIETYRTKLVAGEQLPTASTPIAAAIAAVIAIPYMVERHRHQGISAAVSVATAADIALWITEHHRRNGSWGLSESHWIRHHLAGTLIRLGRLQFMLASCDLPLNDHDPLKPGDPIIEVHIPAGESLSPVLCAASFDAARRHFAHTPWVGFTCVSWLLAPRLNEVVPATSHILAFQRLFTPLPCAMDDRQTIERVFGMWPLQSQDAPRITGLQRALIEFYARGNQLNGGAGFICR